MMTKPILRKHWNVSRHGLSARRKGAPMTDLAIVICIALVGAAWVICDLIKQVKK